MTTSTLGVEDDKYEQKKFSNYNTFSYHYIDYFIFYIMCRQIQEIASST